MFVCVTSIARRVYFALLLLLGLCAIASMVQAASMDYRIAVLDSPVSESKISAGLVSTLRGFSFSVDRINSSELINMDLSAEKYDCLIFIDSPHFPVDITDNVKQYIFAGGDVVLLGGRPFSDPAKYIEGKWYLKSRLMQLASQVKPDKILADMDVGDISIWTRYTNHPERDSFLKTESGKYGKCLSLHISDFLPWDWDIFSLQISEMIPKEHNIVSFWARRVSGKSPNAFVQFDERDGTRWKAVIDLSDKWTYYTLNQKQFSPVDVNDPVQRPGGNLVISDSIRFGFGLAGEAGLAAGGDCIIQIDNLGTAKSAFDSDIAETLESTICVPGDKSADKISSGVFIKAYKNQRLVDTRAELKDKYTGISAFLYPILNKSEYIPLLSVYDKYNRNCGWAAGLLINYDGEYRGSNWLLYGIQEPGFYESRLFLDSLSQVLTAISNRDLMSWAYAENQLRKSRMIKRKPGSKAPYIRLSKDGKHLEKTNGQRFYMVGVNYLGYFDRICYFDKNSFDPVLIESDFKRAHDFGINSMRIWIGDFADNPEARETILALAEKYGIYLLIHMSCWGKSVEEIAAQAYRFASAYKNEPMVIGFDLRNEPQFGEIAGLTKAGQPSPIMQLDAYNRFPQAYNKVQVDEWVKNRPEWPKISAAFTDVRDLRNIYAALSITGKDYRLWGWPLSVDTLKELNNRQADDPWKQVVEATDKTFSNWITPQVEAIKSVSSRFLVTSGYDHPMVVLPANNQLDFVSFHEYGHSPVGRKPDIAYRIQNMSILQKIWPDKPITLGEFGYSNGDKTAVTDQYVSGVAEMAHYLASFANGQDGCMKWQLNDWPVPVQRELASWISPSGYSENESYGMFLFDGTATSRPKPIAYGIRMLKSLVERGNYQGKLRLFADGTTVSSGYEFTSGHISIVGATSYNDKRISWKSGYPVNVMLEKVNQALRITSTADVELKISRQVYKVSKGKQIPAYSGKCGWLRKSDDGIKVLLLAGETVTIR